MPKAQQEGRGVVILSGIIYPDHEKVVELGEHKGSREEHFNTQVVLLDGCDGEWVKEEFPTKKDIETRVPCLSKLIVCVMTNK